MLPPNSPPPSPPSPTHTVSTLTTPSAGRWVHMAAAEDEPLDFYAFMKLAIQDQTPRRAGEVCRLLERFRREMERDSAHGRYFEAGCMEARGAEDAREGAGQTGDSPGGPPRESSPGLDSLRFVALPYITYGAPAAAMDELRRAMHPARTLFQHHYRRESAAAIAARDAEQVCRKVRGPGSRKILLVGYLWMLRLGDELVATAASSSAPGEELWAKLKLVEMPAPALQGKSGESTSVARLARDVDDALAELIRVEWRIEQMLPALLSALLERYEQYAIRLAGVVQSYAVLRVMFKPRLILGLGRSLAQLSTDRKWIAELSADLRSFTEFGMQHTARWHEFARSEQQQPQLVALYAKVLAYAAHFVRPPLRRDAEWRRRVGALFGDVKQLMVVLEWMADTLRLRKEVFAAAGMREEAEAEAEDGGVGQGKKPGGSLGEILVSAMVPEDSMHTSTAYIGELYAQHLATLQFEAQQAPSKALVKNINYIAEELDIILTLVRTQRKVLTQLAVPTKTLQKVSFFVADLEEYQRSCARLAKITSQQLELLLEHHNKAIVVFTVVTIVFLPLSFVASVFGMNVHDIREMQMGQWVFWATAGAVTSVVVALSLAVAFWGEEIAAKSAWWRGRSR